eukprot:UN21470
MTIAFITEDFVGQSRRGYILHMFIMCHCRIGWTNDLRSNYINRLIFKNVLCLMFVISTVKMEFCWEIYGYLHVWYFITLLCVH